MSNKITLSLLIFLLFFFLAPTMALSAKPVKLPQLSGSLETFLKGIDYGVANENNWVEPDSWQLNEFSLVMDSFLANDFITAHQLALPLGYEVIQFEDTSSKPGTTYYILWETNRLPEPGFTGGGTYVINPKGSSVVLQAPHPVYDRYTSDQAIETYLAVRPKLLALAGTHRNNSSAYSPCTNGGYKKSDSAHYDGQLYYIAHEQMSNYDQNTLFIQFHGFGSSSLSKLQQQCLTSNDKLINLSEGVRYSSDPDSNTFMHILRQQVENDGIITPCVYGNDTTSLGGTWNTTGRLTNDSADACTTNASQSSTRFLHLEQSFRVRASYRDRMADYIGAAITEYFR